MLMRNLPKAAKANYDSSPLDAIEVVLKLSTVCSSRISVGESFKARSVKLSMQVISAYMRDFLMTSPFIQKYLTDCLLPNSPMT